MRRALGLEGIDEIFATRLRAAGIRSIQDLLERGATPSYRRTLAKDTGISGALIQKWVHQADLCRVRGIGADYAQLLQVIGVSHVADLGRRNASRLYNTLKCVNEEEALVRQLPSEPMVYNWVEEARTKERVIE